MEGKEEGGGGGEGRGGERGGQGGGRSLSHFAKSPKNHLQIFQFLLCSHRMVRATASIPTIAIFTVNFSLLHYSAQCNPMWMRGNLGLKLQNSPKLPPIQA